MTKDSYNNCTVNSNSYNCFDKLSDEELLLLEKNRLQLNYKKGETICKQGSFVSHIMYVCKGMVKIFIEDENGQLVLRILPEGQIIGLSSVNDGNNIFQYSAMSYNESVITLIDINIFRQLLKENAGFASEVINILCLHTVQIYNRFFCFTNKQSYGRMADILLCLRCRIFKSPEFELDLTRKELAELTGLSRESVIRILNKFKEDKLIDINNKKIKLLDINNLEEISRHG